jgi:hypothetical protein
MNTKRPDDGASPARPADGATAGSPVLRLAGRPRRPRKHVGQPRESRMRNLFNEAFVNNRREVEVALARCFADPKTVLACVELLARLDGELP